jgi:uncharacterized protein YecE (DUF72 family)
MARVVIDTRPIRNLAGDASIKGGVYESLLEARERKPDVPVFQERTADFTFLRYIGHPEMEQNKALVEEWAVAFSSQVSAGADTFIFCHSPDNMIAPYLCREFHQRMANQIKIPPLPWDEIEPNVFEQGRLF